MDRSKTANDAALVRCIERDDPAGFKSLIRGRRDTVIKIDPSECGQPPLTLTITFGSHDVFDYLLESDADLDGKGEDNWTPLLEAILQKRKSMTESLLRNGADVELPGGKATTWPLLQAVLADDPELVRIVSAYSTPAYRRWAAGVIAELRLRRQSEIRSALRDRPE